jgi:hypothetical protein
MESCVMVIMPQPRNTAIAFITDKVLKQLLILSQHCNTHTHSHTHTLHSHTYTHTHTHTQAHTQAHTHIHTDIHHTHKHRAVQTSNDDPVQSSVHLAARRSRSQEGAGVLQTAQDLVVDLDPCRRGQGADMCALHVSWHVRIACVHCVCALRVRQVYQ